MAHVLDLSDAQKAILYNPHVPKIGLRVVMRVQSKVWTSQNADGTYNFGTEYNSLEIDISSRIKKPVRISTKKPIIANGKGNQSRGANVQIFLANSDTYFATTQDGSILNPDQIQNSTIDIYSTFGGQELLMYSGRVIGTPSEKFGETILTIRDNMMGIVNRPLQVENNPNEANIYTDSKGELVIISNEYNSNGSRFTNYGVLSYFSESGRNVPAIENSDLDKVDLRKISVQPGILNLGKYEIIFTGTRGFALTSPTNLTLTGNVDEDFFSSVVNIAETDWNIPKDTKNAIKYFMTREGFEATAIPDDRITTDHNEVALDDLSGTKITFYTCYTVSGNPISIVKDLLVRAFGTGAGLSAWGSTIIFDRFVNWEQVDEIEKMFHGTNVYVSETNKDNSVFDPSSSNLPISYKNVIERILQHIGCFLIIDTSGKISISNPYLLENQKANIINSDMIQSHEFIGNQTKYESVKIRYGNDLISGGMSSESRFLNFVYEEYDPSKTYLPPQVVTLEGVLYQCIAKNDAGGFNLLNFQHFRANELEISFKYFKRGINDRDIEYLKCRILKEIWNQHIQLSMKVLPNHGLPLEVGDKLEFLFSWSPIKSSIFAELYSVNKQIGGDVVISAVKIEKPEHPKELCEMVICEDKIY